MTKQIIEHIIAGPVFAVPTPFEASGGIDCGALGEFAGCLNAAGADAVVSCGTTGEFSALSVNERMRSLEILRAKFEGTIVAHIGACCAEDCIELMAHARDHANAVLILPPFYLAGVSLEGVKRFWAPILSACRLPVYLYHFPVHTGVAFTVDFVIEMASEYGNVCGIKDSGTDFKLSVAFKDCRPHFQVFVGSEGRTVDSLRHGLGGAVCGLGNAVPELQIMMHENFSNGAGEMAAEIQTLYDSVWLGLRRRLGVDSSVLAKLGIAARLPGYPTHVRPPLLDADAGVREHATAAIDVLLARYGRRW